MKTLLKNAWLLTMDDAYTDIPNGWLLTENGRIAALGNGPAPDGADEGGARRVHRLVVPFRGAAAPAADRGQHGRRGERGEAEQDDRDAEGGRAPGGRGLGDGGEEECVHGAEAIPGGGVCQAA